MALDAYHAQIAEIRARFARRFLPRVTELKDALRHLAADEQAGEARDALHRALHDIGGTAPSLGFAAIGDEARRLELLLAGAAKQSRALTSGEIAELARGLNVLAALAGDIEAESVETPSARSGGRNV